MAGQDGATAEFLLVAEGELANSRVRRERPASSDSRSNASQVGVPMRARSTPVLVRLAVSKPASHRIGALKTRASTGEPGDAPPSVSLRVFSVVPSLAGTPFEGDSRLGSRESGRTTERHCRYQRVEELR